ncbi:porin family protein [Paraglaciecola aquimarina]|uniref:Porin family protein n=1 Tax=Paraglaciecola algarum TaxID=3050085 RepID=A0ABS9D4J0_9ALTE|nr:outer membrane beta-barrel protein [Paraglaciecola sp. G1-23]MCF2947569.1 porin family protein [Paraglaciecola sp. G1-23]
MKFNSVTTLLIILFIANFLANKSALASEEWQNRATLYFGQKHLDKDDFEDKTHGAFGISFDLKRKGWPVSIAMDLMAAGKKIEGEQVNIERVTGGFHLGVRKYWMLNENLEPYLGGGINFSGAEREKIQGATTVTFSDRDTGYWLATGINWKFKNRLTLGAEIRYSKANVNLDNIDVNIGGVYSILSVGYRF